MLEFKNGFVTLDEESFAEYVRPDTRATLDDRPPEFARYERIYEILEPCLIAKIWNEPDEAAGAKGKCDQVFVSAEFHPDPPVIRGRFRNKKYKVSVILTTEELNIPHDDNIWSYVQTK